MVDIQKLYEILEKKIGLPKNKIKELVNERIQKLGGFLTEEGALILVAKDFGIDLFPLIFRNRFNLSFLTEGMKDIEVTIGIGKMLYQNQDRKIYLVFDDTGTAKLVVWNEAAKKIEKLEKETTIFRVKVDRVGTDKLGGLELHVYSPDNIKPEEDKKLVEYLSNIGIRIEDYVEGLFLVLKQDDTTILINPVGYAYITDYEQLEGGKIYYIRGIREGKKIKILSAEAISFEKQFRKVMSDERTDDK